MRSLIIVQYLNKS